MMSFSTSSVESATSSSPVYGPAPKMDRRTLVKMVRAKREFSGCSELAAIAAVKKVVGDQPHLKYLAAMAHLMRAARRRDIAAKRQKMEEATAAWFEGGREAHYIKKWGRFGAHHSWLRRAIERETNSQVGPGASERVWDVPNPVGWAIEEEDASVWEAQCERTFVRKTPLPRCVGCGIRGCAPTDGVCGGLIELVKERWSAPAPIKRVRNSHLLHLLRLKIKALRSARGAFDVVFHYTKKPVCSLRKAVWQMMNEDEHGSGSLTTTKISNVIVSEQHGASMAQEAPAKSMMQYLTGDLINRYDELVQRPFVFKRGIWSATDSFDKAIMLVRLPTDYIKAMTGAPNLVPFMVHRYCRSDIVVRVQLNANKFMMGQLQLAWYYQDDVDVHFDRRNNVANNSQTLHTLINAGTSNEAVLRIPYRYYKPLLEIGKRPDKANPLDLGVLVMRVLNPLQATSTTANSCGYTVFINFENAEFTGMRNAAGNSPFSMSGHATHQMDIAAGVIASQALSIALDKNRDKPTTSAHPTFLAPQVAQSWCIGNKESESSYSLRLTHAQVPHPGSYVDDEFTVRSLCSRYGLVKRFTWATSQASGTQIFSLPAIPMGPESQYYKQEVADVNIFSIPPVAFISNMFLYWRGSLKLRLDFVATQLHTGRILIGYVPGDYIEDMTLEKMYSSTYIEFDLKEQQQVEFLIPFVADKLYWDRYLHVNIRGSDVLAPGYVYAFVLAPLVGMDSISPSIDINMYLAGGDDFEVAVPAQPTIGLSFNPAHLVPTTATAYPITGSYPFYVGTYTHLDINDDPIFSKDQLFAILRYGPIYEHISQFFMSKRPDYKKPVSYYLKLKDFASKGWNIRNPDKEHLTKVEFFVPWYDDDFVYVLPCKSEDLAKEWCQLMNANNGNYRKFLSRSLRPDKFFFVYPNDDADPYVDADGTMSWEVLAESGKKVSDDWELVGHHQMDNRFSVESGVMHSAGTVASASGGMLQFGEEFSDLKNLCRRYQPYCAVMISKSDFAKYAPGAVMFSFPVLPQGLHLNIGDTTTPFWFQNYAREGHIPLLLSGYRYFRGSLRFRAILPDADATYFIQHIPNAKWRSEDVSVRKTSDYALGLDHMINHSFAYTVQTRRINQVVSFEVPFYLPYDACILQRFKYSEHTYKDVINASHLGEVRIGLLCAGQRGDIAQNCVFQIAYSFGDDARPSTFQGFPPVALTQDIPLKAEHQGLGDMFKLAKNVNSHVEEISKFNLNKTVEDTAELLQGLKNNSTTLEKAMEGITSFSAKGSEAFTQFIENLKVNQVPQVILQGLSQIAHVLNNPTPSTMTIAVISFLTSIGLVATTQFGSLFELLEKIFKSFQPQRHLGKEATAKHQMDQEDGVALASVLMAGISTALNFNFSNKNEKFSKGIALDLMNGVVTGTKDGSFFFRFLSNIIGVVIKLFNKAKTFMCPVTLGLEHMLADGKIVERWAQECMKLTDVSMEPLFDVYPILTERVHACYVIGSLLYTKIIHAPRGVNTSVLKDLYTKITLLKTELADKGMCSSVRREPFVICMFGAPGIGKSHMANTVLLRLLRDANIEYNTAPIYSHPAGAKYWENVNQEPAMLMDDAFVLRSGETADTEVSTMMSLKSCALFTPPIAACDRKKKRYSPELVYYHTNMAFPTISNMNCAQALYRRRDLLWKADIKEGTTMGDYTSDQLDACDHLVFRLHRAPSNKEQEHEWSNEMTFQQFYDLTKVTFINFRTKQIAAHSKKIEFLTAAVQELTIYPEINQMPLLDILKLYTDGSKFLEMDLFKTEATNLVATHQAPQTSIFLSYLKNKFINKETKDILKKFFDTSDVVMLKGIVKAIKENKADTIVVADKYRQILDNYLGNEFIQRAFEDLNILEKSPENMCFFESFLRNLRDEDFKRHDRELEAKKQARELAEKAEAKRLKEKADEDAASSSSVDSSNSANSKLSFDDFFDNEDVVGEGKVGEEKTICIKEHIATYFNNLKEAKAKKENGLCCFHKNKISQLLGLKEIGEIFGQFPVLKTTQALADIAASNNLEIMGDLCPHYFAFLRNVFTETLSDMCCFGTSNIRHFCKTKESFCSKNCPANEAIPMLDTYDKCPYGNKCIKNSKIIKRNALQLYAVKRPHLLKSVLEHSSEAPQIFFTYSYLQKLGQMKAHLGEMWASLKEWFNELSAKFWKGLRVVKDFFLDYGKWFLGAFAVLGAGLALYKREAICDGLQDAVTATKRKWETASTRLKEHWSGEQKIEFLTAHFYKEKLFSAWDKTSEKLFPEDYWGQWIEEGCWYWVDDSGMRIWATSEEAKELNKIIQTGTLNFEGDIGTEEAKAAWADRASHQIIASGDQKTAGKIARTEFMAKTISNAQAIAPRATHQMDHHDVVNKRIISNTITIVGYAEPSVCADFSTSGKYMRALVLGGRWVLTNLHSLEVFQYYNLTNWRCFINERPCSINMADVSFSKIDDSTLVVLKMPANFPQFKKIVPYFASESDHIFRRPSNGQIISVNPESVTRTDCTIGVRHKVLEIDGLQGASSIDIANLYEYNTQAPGMCGSLLVAPSLNSPIIGMHIAGIPECNLGFAEPLFRETFAFLFEGLITDIPEPEFEPASEAKMDLQTSVFPVGCAGKFAKRPVGKTAIVQSAIHGYVKPKTAPAPLSAFDPRLPQGAPSPMRAGCEKHGEVTKNFPKGYVDRAAERLLNHLKAKCKPLRQAPLILTDQQAVCGDPQLAYCEPLNWNSSEGFPYSSIRPSDAHNKKWLFNLEETNSGLRLLDYNEPLKSILVYKRNQRAAGVVQPTIFTDCLKDSRISIEKCSVPGKTRIFSMSPVDFTIDFRKYFTDFIAAFQSQRFNNMNMIGINPHGPEWDSLAMRLRTYGDVCTGDYSNFGPGLNEVVAEACMNIILDWYDHFDSVDLDVKRTRACLANELIGSLHLCEDLIYKVVAGIPSGSPITVVLNSLVNIMYLFIAFDMLSESWPVEMRDFSLFDKHILLYTYGDDFIFSVSPVFRDFYNSKILSEFFKKFDIKLTDAFKGAEVTPFSTLEKSSFLKGSFVNFLGQYWYGLDTDQIFDMVNFVNSSHNLVELTIQNAEQSLIYAHGHGATFFNDIKSKLTHAFAEKNIVFHGRTFKQITELKREVTSNSEYRNLIKKLLPVF